jgi:hypothetical protein
MAVHLLANRPDLQEITGGGFQQRGGIAFDLSQPCRPIALFEDSGILS